MRIFAVNRSLAWLCVTIIFWPDIRHTKCEHCCS